MSILFKRPRWVFYVGRDFERDLDASISLCWLRRLNAPEGELNWRYSIQASWNWLPTWRWRHSFHVSRIRKSDEEQLASRMARGIAKLPLKLFKRERGQPFRGFGKR